MSGALPFLTQRNPAKASAAMASTGLITTINALAATKTQRMSEDQPLGVAREAAHRAAETRKKEYTCEYAGALKA